jgi:hypothetical protein
MRWSGLGFSRYDIEDCNIVRPLTSPHAFAGGGLDQDVAHIDGGYPLASGLTSWIAVYCWPVFKVTAYGRFWVTTKALLGNSRSISGSASD